MTSECEQNTGLPSSDMIFLCIVLINLIEISYCIDYDDYDYYDGTSSDSELFPGVSLPFSSSRWRPPPPRRRPLPGHVSFVSSPFLVDSRQPLAPHLLSD